MTVEKILKSYILENFLFTDDESELPNDDSFLESGIVDSTGIMEIVSFLKMKFKIYVEDDEMIPENLDSINNLVAYVQKKQA